MTFLSRAAILVTLASFAAPVLAVDVKIDTRPARAVLKAVQTPDLTIEQARLAVHVTGNSGVVRKLIELGTPVTDEDFANALVAAAHGRTPVRREELAFGFDRLRPRLAATVGLLDEMDQHPDTFRDVIQARIALFTPGNPAVALKGYVVAAGDGGGYAFGTQDFYMNMVAIDDLAFARSVTTHEMYHAIQGVFAKERLIRNDEEEARHPDPSACHSAERMFANIYEEGSAEVVSDATLLAGTKSETGLRIKGELEGAPKRARMSALLLEMSFAAFSAPRPVSYHDVYAVGFYGKGILYDIGLAMARAVTDADGPAGLAAYARHPAQDFVSRYVALPQYGKDEGHPALGANTLAALEQVRKGCQ
jgi:hypothetical protein